MGDGGRDQDPRIERSRRVVLEATIDELGAVGYGALTIEAVAARAGVAKSTIYRHWEGKLDLVEDAFRTLKAQALVAVEGPLRERVIGFLEQIAKVVEESTYSSCMPALIEAAERDPQVRAFHCEFSTGRRDILLDVLRDAQTTGELPEGADPELLTDALLGPLVLWRLMLFQPFDPTRVPALVDQVLPRAAR